MYILTCILYIYLYMYIHTHILYIHIYMQQSVSTAQGLEHWSCKNATKITQYILLLCVMHYGILYSSLVTFFIKTFFL